MGTIPAFAVPFGQPGGCVHAPRSWESNLPCAVAGISPCARCVLCGLCRVELQSWSDPRKILTATVTGRVKLSSRDYTGRGRRRYLVPYICQ